MHKQWNPSVGRSVVPNLNSIFHAMRGRHSSKPVDKVCAIALPLQRYGFRGDWSMTLPIYDPSTSSSTAWAQLVLSITSTKFLADDDQAHTPTIQLLYLFPHPSRHHWFPSWAQVQQYPDVSVRDSDQGLVLPTGDVDYSLCIVSGRIYRGCSFQLIRPRTPKAEVRATYRCNMGIKSVHLVATVPGIKLFIDSSKQYVLVDITPNSSLKCSSWGCYEEAGREHRPLWLKSVIIVCEEVDTVAQSAVSAVDAARATKWSSNSPSIMRYRLRRVTTLEWDCKSHGKNDYYTWLPLEPSLVDISSALCSKSYNPDCPSTSDTKKRLLSTPDMFCDPELADVKRKVMERAIGR